MRKAPAEGKMPLRTCRGCGEKRSKLDLIRFAADQRDLVVPDDRGRLPGRGVYCCRRQECLAAFMKRKGRLAKLLRRTEVRFGDVDGVIGGLFPPKSG